MKGHMQIKDKVLALYHLVSTSLFIPWPDLYINVSSQNIHYDSSKRIFDSSIANVNTYITINKT